MQASDPSKGFKYLYLSDADYRALTQGAGSATLRVRPLQAEGQQRWQLTDVVGAEDGLGVECLSGSGAIARWAARIIMGWPMLLLMLERRQLALPLLVPQWETCEEGSCSTTAWLTGL